MNATLLNLFIMLVSAYLTLIVPPWLLPVTMGAGLLMLVRALRDIQAQKNPHR
jgi:hypothetical protein